MLINISVEDISFSRLDTKIRELEIREGNSGNEELLQPLDYMIAKFRLHYS